jgi:hypothetical protein
MAFIDVDWTNLELYHWVLIGGGAAALLALALYLIPGVRSSRGLRVPVIVGALLSGLAVGLGAGVVLMAGWGFRLDAAAKELPPPAGMPKGFGGPPLGGGKGMFGKGGKGGLAKGGAAKAPSAKTQLADLVQKLDQLTGPPLAVKLTPEERGKVRRQLGGLGEKEDLQEPEAKRRLDNLLDALQAHKATLEAVGYPWPVPEKKGVVGPAPQPPNPFRGDKVGKHLHDLEERLRGKSN